MCLVPSTVEIRNYFGLHLPELFHKCGIFTMFGGGSILASQKVWRNAAADCTVPTRRRRLAIVRLETWHNRSRLSAWDTDDLWLELDPFDSDLKYQTLHNYHVSYLCVFSSTIIVYLEKMEFLKSIYILCNLAIQILTLALKFQVERIVNCFGLEIQS